MNVPLYQEQNKKGLQDFLESVMSDPRPSSGDEYRDKDGKLRFRIDMKGQLRLTPSDIALHMRFETSNRVLPSVWLRA